MRFSASRVARTLGFFVAFYLVLKFFPGLPFLNFRNPDGRSLHNGVAFVVESVNYFRSQFWPSQRGSWLQKLDITEEDFRHLEHYCEGPQLNVSKRSEQETLLAVQMLIRHGDRGALFTVKGESHVDCPFDESSSMPETFLAYHEAASKPKTADPFDSVPGKSGCLNGELTSKGVIQHLELGAAVRQRLGISAQEWNLDKMGVHSTRYPRTYQSAMAFLHGLDPSLKFLPRNIEIAAAGDHTFCGLAGSCSCVTSKQIGEEYIRLKTKFFEEDPTMVALTGRIRDILSSHLENPLKNWPPHVFDVLLQFACHGKRMPCFGGTCISYHELVEVVKLLENLASQLTLLPVVRQFSVLDAYGLLRIIVDNLDAVLQGNGTDQSRFTLFSAHDATVVPVMHALGLPFRIVIPYASFVLFELYSLNSDKVYIRVVYNGQDVTGQTLPAARLDTSTTPCPFSLFKEFIDFNLKAEFRSACQLDA